MTRVDPMARPRWHDREQAAAAPPARWPHWVLLIALTFLSLESLLLALTMQGRWMILIAPAAVCASKAWEQWLEMSRRGLLPAFATVRRGRRGRA